MQDSSVTDLCHRHGLEVISALPGRTGASLAVLHVRTTAGEDLVLKQTTPLAGPAEIAVLRTASGSGTTPRFAGELEPGVYLAEWLPSRSLAEVPPTEPVDTVALGHTLRAFHRINPPPRLRTIGDGLYRERSGGWLHLPPLMQARGEAFSAVLDDCRPSAQVLLHGDLAPTNVLLTTNGPRLIDPVGLCGSPAWDLAQVTVTTAGRGRQNDVLPALLDGYGAEPPHLAEVMAWMVLHHLDKSLAIADSPFAPHLRPLAEMVAEACDADDFLRRYLR
jgi:hypothetical protein